MDILFVTSNFPYIMPQGPDEFFHVPTYVHIIGVKKYRYIGTWKNSSGPCALCYIFPQALVERNTPSFFFFFSFFFFCNFPLYLFSIKVLLFHLFFLNLTCSCKLRLHKYGHEQLWKWDKLIKKCYWNKVTGSQTRIVLKIFVIIFIWFCDLRF